MRDRRQVREAWGQHWLKPHNYQDGRRMLSFCHENKFNFSEFSQLVSKKGEIDESLFFDLEVNRLVCEVLCFNLYQGRDKAQQISINYSLLNGSFILVRYFTEYKDCTEKQLAFKVYGSLKELLTNEFGDDWVYAEFQSVESTFKNQIVSYFNEIGPKEIRFVYRLKKVLGIDLKS